MKLINKTGIVAFIISFRYLFLRNLYMCGKAFQRLIKLSDLFFYKNEVFASRLKVVQF